ncbi:MAG: type VI secretion system-associated protein TagF, partial [Paracoccaceae bacterium]
MALAAYGKHPAKGDFLAQGVPFSLQAPLEGWLDQVLAEARWELGAAWEGVWRDAPLLRFWVGEGVWGQPVAGVMAASQDRVGRRFPLILFCAGSDAALLPPPTIGGDGGWYDRMAVLMAERLAARDIAGPADLVAGGVVPEVPDNLPEPGPEAFWAVRPGVDVAGLLADVALTDHRRAAAARSYWWVAGGAPVVEDAKPEEIEPVPEAPAEPIEAPPPVEA